MTRHMSWILWRISLLSFREPSITCLTFGPTKMSTISEAARLDLTHKKPNCRLSGKLISLKFCLGMRIGNQTKFMSINIQASSLHSLIADGIYRPTSLGRIYWKTMIGSQASLQTNCNREGFNAACERPDTTTNVRARIGILGNGQNDCVTCDSRIGFGMQGIPDDKNTCGNAARVGDNGQKYIKTFGYILVQWNRNNVILPVKNTY